MTPFKIAVLFPILFIGTLGFMIIVGVIETILIKYMGDYDD